MPSGKKEKDIRWLPTSAKSVCGRTDIRRSSKNRVVNV